MPSSATVFRIVLISPGDTSDERNVVANLVHRLNAAQVRWTNRLLWLDRWEDAPPGASATNPQSLLDDFLRIESSDVVIAIFRRRLGGSMEGQSGTLHELNQARKAFEEKAKPDVFVYFHKSEEGNQSESDDLSAFKKTVHSWALSKEYTTIEDFGNIVSCDILSWQNKVTLQNPESGIPKGETAPLQVIVHSPFSSLGHDGLTERLLPITLQLERLSKQMRGNRADISLYFNTNITSRIIGPHGLSEIVLRNQAATVLYRARHTSASSIVFEGVQLEAEQSGQTLIADHVRVNARLLGVGAVVTCWSSFLPSTGYRFSTVVANPAVTVGNVKVNYSVTFRRLSCQRHERNLSIYTLECRISEREARCFQLRSPDGASNSTRFLFQFVSAHDGIVVEPESVATRETDGAVVARQVWTDTNGADGPERSYPLAFEWISATPSDLPQGVIFRFVVKSSIPITSGALQALANLAPLATITTASDASPIPRFVVGHPVTPISLA